VLKAISPNTNASIFLVPFVLSCKSQPGSGLG
jgi:hypothetical protein